jgi:hypothetical protein
LVAGQPAGHDIAPHDALMLQVTPHWHAELHSTPPEHALTPVQLMSQSPGPHVVVPPHELTPEHVTAHPAEQVIPAWQDEMPPHCTTHDTAPAQSTLPPHALSPQRTAHAIPGGHVMSDGQLPSVVHVNRQAP